MVVIMVTISVDRQHYR